MACPDAKSDLLLRDEGAVALSGNTTTVASSIFAWKDPHFLAVEVKLIFTALALIYIGAHAALRRPPSAAPAVKTKSGRPRKKKPSDDDVFTQGLLPSDAIIFPIMAGIVLVGLYYLIQWLQDPAILNKILRGYISIMGIFSLTSLIANTIQNATSFLFPLYYRKGRTTYLVDGVEECLRPITQDGSQDVVPPADSTSPIPWAPFLVRSHRGRRYLWEIRHLITEEWAVKLKLHGFSNEKFSIQFSHILGFLLACAVVAAYHVTNHMVLSNFLGYGLCYGTFLIMSPTTFPTGTLILCGLFVYDIVMVFYTPYMITVATKLDAPIKLTFASAAKSSILGLGDIVVPGMVMALALRFDLWRFYNKQVKYIPTELKSQATGPTSDDVVVASEIQHMAKKTPYIDVTGSWADRFWVSTWPGLLTFSKPGKDAPISVQVAAFPKTYFYASLVGYTLGLLVTLAMLVVFRHGQPALLYLVPGVLGSLWLTGLVRGELKQMWTYTEDGTLDTQDVIVELDSSGNVIKEIKDNKQGTDEKDSEEKKKRSEQAAKAAKSGYNVFHFSVRAPPRDPGKADVGQELEKKAL
ncbi:Signal peptide peptidase like protein [Verticillium longisporum]|uniref:Signal peptide peptidase like protein n=1 Tax=Verticillium longisporum TaxID=100787 RepID=A0A8I2ZJU2_VERLO|nr:Signal peptide peptidase like protein [Verticillium longisporum]